MKKATKEPKVDSLQGLMGALNEMTQKRRSEEEKSKSETVYVPLHNPSKCWFFCLSCADDFFVESFLAQQRESVVAMARVVVLENACGVRHFPKNLARCKNMELLKLKGTYISELPKNLLEIFPKLRFMDISDTYVSEPLRRTFTTRDDIKQLLSIMHQELNVVGRELDVIDPVWEGNNPASRGEKRCRSTNLSLVTWNIKNFGEVFAGRDYAKIVQVLSGFDLCAVQECQWVPSLGTDNPAKVVFEDLDRRGYCAVYPNKKTWHPDVPNGGEYPLLFYRTDSFTLIKAMYLPVDGDPQGKEPFKRNPFAAQFKTSDGRVLFVISVHLDVDKVTRLTELKALSQSIPCGWFRQGAICICGDMNFASKSEHDGALERQKQVLDFALISVNATCDKTNDESNKTSKPFDHIWLDPSFEIDCWGSKNGYGMMPLSDHRPLWCRLLWKE